MGHATQEVGREVAEGETGTHQREKVMNCGVFQFSILSAASGHSFWAIRLTTHRSLAKVLAKERDRSVDH